MGSLRSWWMIIDVADLRHFVECEALVSSVSEALKRCRDVE